MHTHMHTRTHTLTQIQPPLKLFIEQKRLILYYKHVRTQDYKLAL